MTDASHGPTGPGPAPRRTVIVDDTPDLRALLRIVLEHSGYLVVGEAGDGRSGIDVVREHRPEVVLLDLSMPVMDGLEALPMIRQLVPDASVVVLSGFGPATMSERARAVGADGYLQKGARLPILVESLDRIVAGRGSERPAEGAQRADG